MNDTYTTKLDMQTGTINICGGDTRFQFVIDEVPEIIESLKSEYERAKQIMGNPLLDTRGVDEAMKALYSGDVPYDLKVMADFYLNTLVMLSELKVLLDRFEPHERFLMQHIPAAMLDISDWRDKLAAILEAHKQHMPEGL